MSRKQGTQWGAKVASLYPSLDPARWGGEAIENPLGWRINDDGLVEKDDLVFSDTVGDEFVHEIVLGDYLAAGAIQAEVRWRTQAAGRGGQGIPGLDLALHSTVWVLHEQRLRATELEPDEMRYPPYLVQWASVYLTEVPAWYGRYGAPGPVTRVLQEPPEDAYAPLSVRMGVVLYDGVSVWTSIVAGRVPREAVLCWKGDKEPWVHEDAPTGVGLKAGDVVLINPRSVRAQYRPEEGVTVLHVLPAEITADPIPPIWSP